MGPNFLLSRITAWKNAKPKSNFLYSMGFDGHDSNASSVMSANVRPTLARRPFGGSFVIFRPPCSTGTGKAAEGMLVSHRR